MIIYKKLNVSIVKSYDLHSESELYEATNINYSRLMKRQSNKLNFAGQNIYVGIDVHLKSWNVTILTEKLYHKAFTQPSSPTALYSYLQAHFPGGNYNSAYDNDFCRLWAHYAMTNMGVSNVVVNPADVPTT